MAFTDLVASIAQAYPDTLRSMKFDNNVIFDVRFEAAATNENKAAVQAMINEFDINTPSPDIQGFFAALGEAISNQVMPGDVYLLSLMLKDQPTLQKQQEMMFKFSQNPVYTTEQRAALNALIAQYHLELPSISTTA